MFKNEKKTKYLTRDGCNSKAQTGSLLNQKRIDRQTNTFHDVDTDKSYHRYNIEHDIS